MNKSPVINRLILELRRGRVLRGVQALLDWDEQVSMPPKAAGSRAAQIEAVAEIAHKLDTSDALGDAISSAEADAGLTDEEKALVREVRYDYDRARKVPADLVAAVAAQRSRTYQAWVEARRTDKFVQVSGELTEMFKLTLEQAKALNSGEPLYDTLLEGYERGTTTEDLDTLFGALGPTLSSLLLRIEESKAHQKSAAELGGLFPKDRQEKFGLKLLEAIGFDLKGGRLDPTVHPFCTEIGPGDVRLCTRYDEADPFSGMYSTMHEAGHGIYEQGLSASWAQTPLGEAASMGIHESQSLLYEDQFGRSRPFWRWAAGPFRESFLKSVPAEQLYAATNRAAAGFIRVNADEVSYGLHIIIRFEMEKAIVSGDLRVEEIPSVWREKYSEYLGIEPPNDTLGCLQDVHWHIGHLGYFPTYLIGRLYSAQIYQAFLKSRPGWDEEATAGSFASLKSWLNSQIHCHGRRYSARELIKKATGSEASAEPFIGYVEQKYSELYGL